MPPAGHSFILPEGFDMTEHLQLQEWAK